MDTLSQQIASLSPQKRALLEQRIGQAQRGAARPPDQPARKLPPLVADPQRRSEPFPLTEMQQAYWIGRSATFQLGNVATHFYQEFESEQLDIQRLSAAWQQLIERHEMLRAIVLPTGQQQILSTVPVYTIQVTDLRDQPRSVVAAQLDAIRQQMSHQVFQTERWPLFDLRISQLSSARIRIHISIDGLLMDAWSYQIVLREWFQLYQQPDQALPPLELSFRDYVLSEVALRETELYQRSLAYWRERLPTLPPAPDLPLAIDPATVAAPRFERWSRVLPPDVWQRLKARAAQADLTPASMLIAAYGQVLALWSRRPQLTLNIPRFNRLPLHPQVNQIVGEFASFTLLAIDTSSQQPFSAWASALQSQLWRDLDHGYVSGVQLLRELPQAQQRPFQAQMPVVFTSAPQDVHGKNASLMISPTARGEVVYNIGQTSQVWLDHEYYEEDGSLVLNWDAVAALFPAGLIDDMFGAYAGLIERLADDDAAWQSSATELAALLLPAEQGAQRQQINATQRPVRDRLLHTLVMDQAALRPEQTALITPTRRLSYAELMRAASQLAHELRRGGAQPNTLVAVVMDKGWEQVVGVLGILQAGAAYLPIDPELPKERRWLLLHQSQATLLVTQSWLDQQLEWPANVRRICVDQQADVPEAGVAPIAATQSPDDLAYVIYTSGSTGTPKGCMITQRGVVNAILDTNETFGIGPTDRVLGLTALHHDMSVFDLFGTLAAGGTLVLPEAVARRDPSHWLTLMQQEQISVWNSVPAMLEMLLEYTAAHLETQCPSLRLAFLGGDWISLMLPDRLRAVAPQAQLVSVGGPTETTLWNIWYPVTAIDPTWKSIPYGRPIANTAYYVLNDLLNDCPTWVAGQLYCSGVGVAQGYWRDPARTADSFIMHPRTGARLYRTGDLGRYLPDGTIEFLGREDFQVKIQGQRIELGEIEATLTHHPAVRAAVVTAVKDEQGRPQLAAYVVPQQATPPAAAGTTVDDLIDYQSDRITFKLDQRGLRAVAADQPTIDFPAQVPDSTLLETYARRRSYRLFQHEPIALPQLATTLSCLAQVTIAGAPLPKYRYPSGGGLYPVQVYLQIKPDRVAGIDGGIYYYHPKQHRLVLLRADAMIAPTLHAPINHAVAEDAAFAIFLIGELAAIEPIYGDLSRDLCLLEAGYMSQLLMSVAPEQLLGLCPVGSLQFEAVRDLFDLSSSHVLLHCLLGGAITPEQRAPQAWLAELSAASSALIATQVPAPINLTDELQRFLQDRLPRHMLPTSLLLLDALPLTANGKVDRQQLSTQVLKMPRAPHSSVAPQTEHEQRIAAIWKALLGIDQIGVHDNFFEMGANSIHIVQAHNRLSEEFGQEIPIVEMFKNPTIAFLAKYVHQEQTAPAAPPSFQTINERAQKQKAAMARKQQSKPDHQPNSKPR